MIEALAMMIDHWMLTVARLLDRAVAVAVVACFGPLASEADFAG